MFTKRIKLMIEPDNTYHHLSKLKCKYGISNIKVHIYLNLSSVRMSLCRKILCIAIKR